MNGSSVGEDFLLFAPVDVPPTEPGRLDALGEALSRAGLAVGALRAHGSSAERARQLPFSSANLAALAADATVEAIELRGAPDGAGRPAFNVRVPTVLGFLVARFSGRALDPLGLPALTLFGQLFELGLGDWGVGGPAGELEPLLAAILADTPAPEQTGPSVPPTTSWVNFFSIDLAPQIDRQQLVAVAPLRSLSTHTGGALIALRQQTPPDPAADAVLYACTEGARQPFSRPPIDLFDRPGGGEPLLLRDLSPPLLGDLRRQAGAAAELALQHGCAGRDGGLLAPGVEGLEALLGCVAGAARSHTLSPPLIEACTAFAGQSAAALGGRWRRILHPDLPCPENLLVQLPNAWPFSPAAAVREALRADRPTSAASALRALADRPAPG